MPQLSKSCIQKIALHGFSLLTLKPTFFSLSKTASSSVEEETRAALYSALSCFFTHTYIERVNGACDPFFFLIKSVRAGASVFVHNNHFSLFVVPEVCITCLLSSQKVCCFFPFCCCSSPISALAIHGRLFRHFGCLFPSSYPHTYHLHITLRSSFSPVERKERKQIQYSKGLRCFFVPLTEIKLEKVAASLYCY